MATIAVDGCRPVKIVQQLTLPASEAITAGNPVVVDNTSGGKWALHGGTEVGIIGIATKDAVAGEALTAVLQGIVDIGDGLDGENYNAAVFAGDGVLEDTTGVPLGFVVPAFGSTTADKLLYLSGTVGLVSA